LRYPAFLQEVGKPVDQYVLRKYDVSVMPPEPRIPQPQGLLLDVQGVTKYFPGVVALSNISFAVVPGEVHALLGENGAGKSTLLKILSGAQHQDGGTIRFDDKLLGRESPLERQRLGIVTVYQEFNLMPNLSVAENILIGREPAKFRFIDWTAMYRKAREVAQRLDLLVDPRTPVVALSVAEQQLVEIAKAINLQAKLIVLDEPTAALSNREVARLHKLVLELKRQNIAFIYVTHRLDEVPGICDRFTVFRDGKLAGSGDARHTGTSDIIRMMVGRDLEAVGRSKRGALAETVLRVVDFTRTKKLAAAPAIRLRRMNLELRRGEILGLAGLVGAGRTELARAIFGVDPIESGELYLDGKVVSIKSPRDAIRLGIAMVPEDRKQQGLFLNQSIRHNLSLSNLPKLSRLKCFVDQTAENSLIERFRRSLQIRMPSPDTVVRTLSGGNQQKVILARCLALSPKILIVDEPTRGIDVGTKAEVHHLLRQLAATGTAILVISSELPELLSLCDRICTVKEGRITGQMWVEEASEEKLMTLMTLAPTEQHTHAVIT
jgi:inositol transport system ATP-binding protein